MACALLRMELAVGCSQAWHGEEACWPPLAVFAAMQLDKASVPCCAADQGISTKGNAHAPPEAFNTGERLGAAVLLLLPVLQAISQQHYKQILRNARMDDVGGQDVATRVLKDVQNKGAWPWASA